MSFSQGHALLVGVGTYRDQPNLNVPVCALDAEAVAEVLRDPNLCGYPANQVGLLRNATARRDDILIGLETLADRAAGSDTLFLFFCGHGAYGDDGDYYLTTHDTRVRDGRVVSGTGVREAELLERLRRVRAKRVLLVINACHSGGISPTLGADDAALTDTPLPSKTAAALLATGEGRIIITACREGQLSWIGKGKLSLFAQALVDGLQGRGTSSSRGFLNAFDLYTHLYFRVKDSVEREYRQDQEPELTVLKGVGPFAVALYRGATSLGGFADAGPPPEGTAAREIDPAYARAMLNQFQLHIGDTHQANLTGNGALAQGPGAQAVGAGGVLVGGTNTGPINTGTQVDTGGGAYVSGPVEVRGGDFVGRDKTVHGDRITTGSASGTGMAIGPDANAKPSQAAPPAALDPLFDRLRATVAGHPRPEQRHAALQRLQAIRAELENGDQTDDTTLARAVDDLAGLVPESAGEILRLFGTPTLAGATGQVTRFVLDKLGSG